MKFSTSSILAAAMALAPTASAHMQMSDPPPFRSKFNKLATTVDDSMTSPLSASGSDFPCKGYQKDLGTPAGGSVATYAPGSSQKITIVGGATHGGGSCQISLSYDGAKTFTVIHSIVGKCPMSDGEQFAYKIPADAKSGEAVLAWTWINHIGKHSSPFFSNELFTVS